MGYDRIGLIKEKSWTEAAKIAKEGLYSVLDEDLDEFSPNLVIRVLNKAINCIIVKITGWG